jgi:hypothetical protein
MLKRIGVSFVFVVLLMALFTFGGSPAAFAQTTSSTHTVALASCQSTGVTVEGERSGHVYTCTGMGQPVYDWVYYMISPHWSGYLHTNIGTLLFCDGWTMQWSPDIYAYTIDLYPWPGAC